MPDSRSATTPADLYAAFGRVSEYDKTIPVDASLDGYRGKSLRITLPDELGDCHEPGRAVLWESDAQPPKYGLAGERDTIWILDVEGIRLVVDATSFPRTSAANLTAQQRLIDSIRIQRIKTPGKSDAASEPKRPHGHLGGDRRADAHVRSPGRLVATRRNGELGELSDSACRRARPWHGG